MPSGKVANYDYEGNGLKLERRRFFDHIEIDPETGCWNWTRFIHPKTRHGMMGIKYHDRAIMTYVHRVSYMLHIGDPKDMDVTHRCHNPRCCNPEHLEAMTRSEASKRKKGTSKKRVFEPYKGSDSILTAQDPTELD